MDFPQPLFESCLMNQPHICLVCGNDDAQTVLRTTENDVCPICVKCSSNWNIYGYNVFKKIKPGNLIKNICFYKLKNLFKIKTKTILTDLNNLKNWQSRTKRLMKGLE